MLVIIIVVLCAYFFLVASLQVIRHFETLKRLFITYIKPFLTWRILVCYLPFWFLATGWAWLFSFIGKGWFRAVAISWLTFLWMPWCPEKLITIPLAIWLHKKLFPKHSTAHFDNMLKEEKEKFKQRKLRREKQK